MCLLAIVFRVVPEAPIIVGANREEFYARGGEPPRIVDGPLRAVCGVDPIAQGTWLGVNELGTLVAITNRQTHRIAARPRSRGLLARDLLGFRSSTEAAAHALAELGTGQYAGCNVLCLDRQNGIVIHSGEKLEQISLLPGVHVLTAHDVDDMGDERLAYASKWLGGADLTSADECIAALRTLCSQNGDGVPPMVLRVGLGGTVSSSVIALQVDSAKSVYLHAQGPPDVTEYQDYSHLLRQFSV